MSMLEYYTHRVTITKGLTHQAALRTLRSYLKYTPIKQLLFYVRRINKIEQLKALWEAGLTIDLQEAVLRRHEELTTRRSE